LHLYKILSTNNHAAGSQVSAAIVAVELVRFAERDARGTRSVCFDIPHSPLSSAPAGMDALNPSNARPNTASAVQSRPGRRPQQFGVFAEFK
jgi:hypothetical protein